ncbi:hypothetical protein [Phenylobacterium sp.]|uniref:hypothetical protein n=1 Tax=Phenylobacterium sp. TaxID=1871053 RepID=UPI0030F44C72
MAGEDQVLAIVLRALENLNAELEDGQQVPVMSTTPLFGADAELDSLALVSVIVDVEAGLAEVFGRPFGLMDDQAMEREISPFTSVQTLVDYIGELLAQAA